RDGHIMGILKRTTTDPAGDIEQEIATLEQRRDKLAAQLVKVDDDLTAVIRDRRQRLVDGQDFGDDDGRAERLRTQGDDLRDAIEQISGKIVDARARLAQEHDRIARKAEGAARSKQLVEIEAARVQYETAARRLAESLSGVFGPVPQSANLQAIVTRCTND